MEVRAKYNQCRPGVGKRRKLAAWILMLAVLFGGVIPTGYMPSLATENDGGQEYLTMVICTAHGTETITLDASGERVAGEQTQSPIPSDKPGDQGNSLCAFAIAGLALKPHLDSIKLPTTTGDQNPVNAVEQKIDSRPDLTRHPRGPPVV
jgi:hypothetical protein